MSEPVKFTLEGVQVELRALSSDVKLRKKRPGLFSFNCAGCGRRRLEITKEKIKGAGGHTTSKGHARASIFDMVKPANELDRELRGLHDNEKLDYIDYLRRKAVLDRKRRIKEDVGLSGSGSTSMGIDCSLCDRGHKFEVSLKSPVTVDEEPSLIELYEQRGIKKSDENLDYLISIISRHLLYEKPEEWLQRLRRLADDREIVEQTIDKLREVAETHQLNCSTSSMENSSS